MSNFITIQGHKVAPGENAQIQIEVATLPSGTAIGIHAHVFRSKNPGPSILLLGGLHGDEINGVEIVRRAASSRKLDNLQAGSVVAIPLLNVFGFNNFSRSVRDGKDVNRSFPGSKQGSLASRVAYMMTKEILPNIDFGVDFHTGGSAVQNYPQLRVSNGDARALEIAKTFAPPIILMNKPIPKSHRLQAYKMDKPILVFEGGESLRFDEFAIETGITGIHRLLDAHGMLSIPYEKASSEVYDNSRWVRATQAGLVGLKAQAGDRVKKGQLLAEIHNLDNTGKLGYVKSPLTGRIISHNNNPVLSSGDALFHVAY